jgi:hypothetical protein
VSYRDDVSRLARALAELLVMEHRPADPLTPSQTRAALTCRDTVVGTVRDLNGALLRPTPAPLAEDQVQLEGSPAHALLGALRGLPRVAPRDLPLIDALDVRATPPLTQWQEAARAAVALERYSDEVAALPGSDAWSVARDLSALAGVLPALDGDLAAALTGGESSTSPGAPPRVGSAEGDVTAQAVAHLLDESSHGLLQVTAAHLGACTGDVPHAAASPQGSTRLLVPPVTRITDLPGASRRLADVVSHRGPRLTAVEARAALRTVVTGVDVAARVLAELDGSPHGANGVARQDTPGLRGAGEVAAQLRSALPDLQQVLHAQLATLTPPSRGVLLLSQQIHGQLSSASSLHETLCRNDSLRPGADGVGHVLARWSMTAGRLVEAVGGALHAAADDRALLAPRLDAAPGPHARLLWLPIPQPARSHPALEAAQRASASLHQTAGALDDVLTPAAEPPSHDVRRTAADASAAFSQLHAALQSRRTHALPHPSRAVHPALAWTRSPATPPRGKR